MQLAEGKAELSALPKPAPSKTAVKKASAAD
jgi:hypothetical protein